MALTSWHSGKLVILWAWGIAISLGMVRFLGSEKGKEFFPGALVILLLVLIPVGLSILTWRWLGGREKK